MKARKQHTYPVIIEKDEDGFFVAMNSSLPGCYSQGETLDEALRNIQEATALCLTDLPTKEAEAVEDRSVSIHFISA